MRLLRQSLTVLWKSNVASYAREFVIEKVKNINNDIAMMIFSPLVEHLAPYPVRMRLGLAWPESEAEMNFSSRKTDDIQWFLWFAIRSALYGYIPSHIFCFLKREVPKLLGCGPLGADPNMRELRQVKSYFQSKIRKRKSNKKSGIDPISTAFDGMKRVKNPPIPLKDFASIDSMREEINEVVAFLQNPRAFQDMGACAPRVAEKTALLWPVELNLVPVVLESSAFRRKFVDADELLSYCSWFVTFSQIIPKWGRQTKLSRKISRMLVGHLGLTLTKEDMLSVVDQVELYGRISKGIELLIPPVDWSKETKFPHAVWATGRGLIALLLPNFDSVDTLWLEPLSWQGIGCTKFTRARSEDSGTANSESRSYLEKKLVFCFGSHIAAQLLLPFGEENLLSSEELKQAQEIG